MIHAFLIGLSLQAASTVTDPTIVVTGQRITREYQLCQVGGCSPVRDANATLAYAQQQLLDGEYKESRRAIRASLQRNAAAAKTQPLVVSALYDADSTLALHLGDHVDARRSGLKSVALLREAYGDSDFRSIVARARVGDVEAKVGGIDAFNNADKAYDAASDAARAAGYGLLAEAIALRRSYLLASRGQALAAQSRLVRYVDDPASDPRLRTQAAVLGARVARNRQDDQTADRLLQFIGRQPAGSKPILVSAPEIGGNAIAKAIAADKWGDNSSRAFTSGPSAYQPLRWVDIGFWIRPDGRVEEAEILRGSPARDWVRPVLIATEGRRYAPVDATPGDPGRYRIERYTLTGALQKTVDSLVPRRVPPPILRWLDITDDPNRVKAQPAG